MGAMETGSSMLSIGDFTASFDFMSISRSTKSTIQTKNTVSFHVRLLVPTWLQTSTSTKSTSVVVHYRWLSGM